jgi:hypothetical protein
MRIIVTLFTLFGLLMSTGCQTGALDSTAQPDKPDQEIATPDRIQPTMTKLPERVPPTAENAPITGEVPIDLLALVKKDLMERTGTAPEAVLVIQDQEIVWNDGSLGCAQPGVFYTQTQVNGYWIILEAEGVRYDYRAAASGYFFLCEGRIPPGIPGSTPNS